MTRPDDVCKSQNLCVKSRFLRELHTEDLAMHTSHLLYSATQSLPVVLETQQTPSPKQSCVLHPGKERCAFFPSYGYII